MTDAAEKIADLRRKRAAAKGVAERADALALMARVKAATHWAIYRDATRQIEALGGKVRQ